VTASHLRLLVDTDGDGQFADETPINGATSAGSNTYRFSNVTALVNGRRFTLGTTNITATPLPIELLSFTAEADGMDAASLHWATASEQDNAYFTIQRADDRLQWETRTMLPGAGTSTTRLDYGWRDDALPNGTSYYRLGQTDVDGTTVWSQMVPVTVERPLTIVPNPARGRTRVQLEGERATAVLVRDLTGRPLPVPIAIADGSVEFDVSTLTSGGYVLELIMGEQRRSQVFLVE
jgi:hypothetical protein